MSTNLCSLNSLSSSLLFGVTLYRNNSGICGRIAAQIGYFFTGLVAVIESVSATILMGFSLVFYPISSTPFERTVNWLSSCSFCIVWSTMDFIISPFVHVLIADENSAQKVATTFQLFSLPRNAVY